MFRGVGGQGIRREEDDCNLMNKKTETKKTPKRTTYLGRKPRLNDRIIDMAVKLLEAGHFVKMVCDALSLDEKTWYLWMSKGQEVMDLLMDCDTEKEAKALIESIPNGALYLDFYQSIKTASSKAEMKSLATIKRAGVRNWQAHAWFLERRFRERWSRPVEDPNNTKKPGEALDNFINGVDQAADEATARASEEGDEDE